MKILLTMTSVLILSSSLYASNKAPEYYAAHFEVEKVTAMCPSTVPSGAVCMGLGAIVTLKATLGCADSLLFTEIKHSDQNSSAVNLYVVSVVRKHPDSDLIRCFRANEVRKSIVVPYNTINFNLINLGAELTY